MRHQTTINRQPPQATHPGCSPAEMLIVNKPLIAESLGGLFSGGPGDVVIELTDAKGNSVVIVEEFVRYDHCRTDVFLNPPITLEPGTYWLRSYGKPAPSEYGRGKDGLGCLLVNNESGFMSKYLSPAVFPDMQPPPARRSTPERPGQ